MTSKSTFPQRLTKIDEISSKDHYFLTDDDECYYLGEYSAGKGYTYSKTNELILNLKKSMDRQDRDEWKYKLQAIQTVASALRKIDFAKISQLTFVPIPPSKTKDNPLYDDRLVRILHSISKQPSLDVREMIVQTSSIDPVHTRQTRPNPSEIEALYQIDGDTVKPEPRKIALFDDILTTGAHFRAAKSI